MGSAAVAAAAAVVAVAVVPGPGPWALGPGPKTSRFHRFSTMYNKVLFSKIGALFLEKKNAPAGMLPPSSKNVVFVVFHHFK